MSFDSAVERARSIISAGAPDTALLVKRNLQKLEGLVAALEGAIRTQRLSFALAEEAGPDGERLLEVRHRKGKIVLGYVGWADVGFYFGVNSPDIVAASGLHPDVDVDVEATEFSEEDAAAEVARLDDEESLDFYALGPIGDQDVFVAALGQVLPVLVAMYETHFLNPE
jgi:hypothetical protein